MAVEILSRLNAWAIAEIDLGSTVIYFWAQSFEHIFSVVNKDNNNSTCKVT